MTMEEVRQVNDNVVDFFSILMEWDKDNEPCEEAPAESLANLTATN